jgi:hypothetical protein
VYMIMKENISNAVSDRAYAFALHMSQEVDLWLENRIYDYFYMSTGFQGRSSLFIVLDSVMEKGSRYETKYQ